MNRWRW